MAVGRIFVFTCQIFYIKYDRSFTDLGRKEYNLCRYINLSAALQYSLWPALTLTYIQIPRRNISVYTHCLQLHLTCVHAFVLSLKALDFCEKSVWMCLNNIWTHINPILNLEFYSKVVGWSCHVLTLFEPFPICISVAS